MNDFIVGSDKHQKAISFEDFIQACQDLIEANQADSLLKVAPYLQRLSVNRNFLAEVLKRNILASLAEPLQSKWQNTPASILWQDEDFFVRVVFWDDTIDDHSFVHSHNFDFITVGYFGEGYVHDVFTFDGDQEMYPGKRIDINSLGRDRLSVGQVRYFRSDRIIHSFPSKTDFSISINVILKRKNLLQKPQFSFDIEKQQVKDIINPQFDEMLVKMLSGIEWEQKKEFLESFTKGASTSLGRIASISALSKSNPQVWSQYLNDSSAHVRNAAESYMLRGPFHAT